jgi:hypothetical protein
VSNGLNHTDNLSDRIENWTQDFPRRSTPTHNNNYLFQIKHCGSEEIRVKNSEVEIWADGINTKTGELLEAKFIENLTKSPFVDNSNIPIFIRDKITKEVDNEFRRYGAIINDDDTPVVALQVIVNIPEAVPFFTELLNKYKIPGQIVVKSE